MGNSGKGTAEELQGLRLEHLGGVEGQRRLLIVMPLTTGQGQVTSHTIFGWARKWGRIKVSGERSLQTFVLASPWPED